MSALFDRLTRLFDEGHGVELPDLRSDAGFALGWPFGTGTGAAVRGAAVRGAAVRGAAVRGAAGDGWGAIGISVGTRPRIGGGGVRRGGGGGRVRALLLRAEAAAFELTGDRTGARGGAWGAPSSIALHHATRPHLAVLSS